MPMAGIAMRLAMRAAFGCGRVLRRGVRVRAAMRALLGMRGCMGRGAVRRMDGARRLLVWRHLPVLRRVALLRMRFGRAAGDAGWRRGMARSMRG